MKIRKLLLVSLLFALTGCGANTVNDSHQTIDVDQVISQSENKNALGAFDLDNPLDGAIVDKVSTFSWAKSENASTYSLEICSSSQFISNIETIDYYKRDNIVDTSFSINSNFALKEQTYYWRVTAKNAAGTKVCNKVYSFFIKAPAVEEVAFDMGESDDWNLHPLGSYADISVNETTFFGEKSNVLKMSFKEEYTKRGIPESDGWIIATKTIEKSIYGTDALYFNCFYAGQDATIIIRLVDRDNEYWYCPIQISNNAKQSVILKFSDFIQRTGDVTVANLKFDYERIKYLEVVFERTFGDGVFLLSGMKAIKFSNYMDLFITKLNFNDYTDDLYVHDAYNFERSINDDYELQMNYYSNSVVGKEGINGYGFVKINVNRYMFTGNAIKVSIKYHGNPGTNVLLRVYEEDTDRWSYKIPFSTLTADEYSTLIIPYKAFAASSLMGDGKRQFYFILNLQFGLEGQYGTGELYFKDFEVIDMFSDEYKRESVREVGENGLIENFDNYQFNSDAYFIWTQSQVNKDEYIALNTSSRPGSNNVQCGQFEYKSDMEAAQYYLPISAEGDYTSLSIWMRDASIKSGDEKVAYFEKYSPEVNIFIRLATGEIYAYTIPELARAWYEYDIPFTQFTLNNKSDIRGTANKIQASTITHVGFTLSFQYIDPKTNKHIPVYAMSNPVLVDNIYLTNYESFRQVEKDKIVSMDSSSKLAMVDDFEIYESDGDMLDFWGDGRDYSYQLKSLSSDVSIEGGNQSLKLQYLTRDQSPSYFVAPALDSSVQCRAIKFDIRSEHKATVYLNIYRRTDNTERQYRATITDVGPEWTEYVIGFANIKDLSSESQTFSKNYLTQISKISFGMTSYATTEATLSNIYIDNLAFDARYDSTTGNSTMIKRKIVLVEE